MPEGPLASDPPSGRLAKLPGWLPATTLAAMRAARDGRRAPNEAPAAADLYGLQALAMRAVVESGECFVRLLPAERSPGNPVGLRLQVLESDHLDTARNGCRPPASAALRSAS